MGDVENFIMNYVFILEIMRKNTQYRGNNYDIVNYII